MKSIRILEKMAPLDHGLAFGAEYMEYSGGVWIDPTIEDDSDIIVEWLGSGARSAEFPRKVSKAQESLTPSASISEIPVPNTITLDLTTVDELKLHHATIEAVVSSSGDEVWPDSIAYVATGVVLDVTSLSGVHKIFLSDKKTRSFDSSMVMDNILTLPNTYNVHGIVKPDGSVYRDWTSIKLMDHQTKIDITGSGITSGSVLIDEMAVVYVGVPNNTSLIKLDVEVPLSLFDPSTKELIKPTYTIKEGQTVVLVPSGDKSVRMVTSGWLRSLHNFGLRIKAVVEYQTTPLTGPDNRVLGPMTNVSGYNNIAGGYATKIVDADLSANTITVKGIDEVIDSTKFEDGFEIIINTKHDDDTTPYTKTITEVEVESPTELKLTLDDVSDLYDDFENDLSKFLDQTDDVFGQFTAIVANSNREWTCVVEGEYNIVTGWNSSANGNCLVVIGDHSAVFGMCNDVYADISFVAGTANVVEGSENTVYGTNNKVQGSGSYVGGALNKIRGESNIVFGSMNEAYNENDDGYGNPTIVNNATLLGFGNKSRTHQGIAIGSLNEVTKSQSKAIGSQLKNDALKGLILGTYGEMPEKIVLEVDGSTERGLWLEDAVAFGGGVAPYVGSDQESLGFIYSKYWFETNPVYDPEDPGTESPYIITEKHLLTFIGDLEVDSNIYAKNYKVKTNDAGLVISAASPILDMNEASCWKLNATASTTPSLVNWVDGSEGRLIVYNGATKFSIPTGWEEVGSIPTLQSDGYDVFSIIKIDNDVFIEHKFSHSN